MMDQPNEFESAADAFPVKLSNFEGPLDLLLHLIKTNEVNIHDIPIALITQQYLDAIHLMEEMNLDVAGEYLVMAATLIHIKSKMLLPRPETAAAIDGEAEDPRDALVGGCSNIRSSRPRPNCSTARTAALGAVAETTSAWRHRW
jgi:segregation and condensation protein A